MRRNIDSEICWSLCSHATKLYESFWRKLRWQFAAGSSVWTPFVKKVFFTWACSREIFCLRCSFLHVIDTEESILMNESLRKIIDAELRWLHWIVETNPKMKNRKTKKRKEIEENRLNNGSFYFRKQKTALRAFAAATWLTVGCWGQVDIEKECIFSFSFNCNFLCSA